MIRSKLVLSVLALVVPVLPALGGSTWYVDLNATPPGDGSPGSPYTSIQYALDRPTTLSGDEVLVAPGTYVETVHVPLGLDLSSSGGPLVTHILPGDPADPVVVSIPRNAMIAGFTVTRTSYGPGQVGIFARTCPQATHIVSNCIVTNHAIGIDGSYDLFVTQSTVTGNDVGIEDACKLIPYVHDSIVWGNTTVDVRAALGMQIVRSSVGTTAGGSCECLDNVGAPELWNPAAGDVHLRAGSPCIDAGDPAEQDPDGSRRDIGAVPYDPTWAPGTQGFCFGSAAACPCGNGGSGNGGCDLPQGTGGVVLGIEHFAPNGAGGGTAAIVGSGYPPAASPAATLLRGPNAPVPPVVFGDGLRCIAAGGLVRIGAVLGGGGSSLHTISHGAGSGTFRYQLWTRSTPSTFCDANAAFNLSNGLEIAWP
jgi:hypothetical protein